VDGPRLIAPEDFPALAGNLAVFGAAPLPSKFPLVLRVPSAAVLGRIDDASSFIVHPEPLYLRVPHITMAKPVQGLSAKSTIAD
jgi:hypothetical protein